MSDSIGVKLANAVSKEHKINDTVWTDKLITLADAIDSEIEEGERRGRVEVIDIIKKQRKVYWSNLKIAKPKDSAWQEGAYSACNYLIQLIKEKELGDYYSGVFLKELPPVGVPAYKVWSMKVTKKKKVVE